MLHGWVAGEKRRNSILWFVVLVLRKKKKEVGIDINLAYFWEEIDDIICF